jgi:hypothetical protein
LIQIGILSLGCGFVEDSIKGKHIRRFYIKRTNDEEKEEEQ